MTKRLRPTAIIPSEMYVERAADRQLESIVQDMGRPGYILVARQMGKTNLLLNMKRKRQAIGDIVLYVDLSNRFESSRALFRYIVDLLIEAVLDDEYLAEVDIQARTEDIRKDSKIEANVEYEKSLRQILKFCQKDRVIIILDEIDSLIGVPYSDAFFAQIRSMYFSRTNHSIYERLTYVLSGVAEPGDLIKDKNISPFNIGEKIYLDDFSFEEHTKLLDRAKLPLSEEVAKEVFLWVEGNPRMTWDVLSELEDILISGRVATKGDVKATIDKLYLQRFDRAPVDHIRSLAENDPQIRNSIASIRWGKGDSLDPKARSRLYLAGISRVSGADPATFKNRVIDAALSDSWLAHVAAQQKSILEVASDHYNAGRFGAAIQMYEAYLVSDIDERHLSSDQKFTLALSYFNESRFNEAVIYLMEIINVAKSKEFVATCKYYIGSALFKLGQIDESIIHLLGSAECENEMQNAARIALSSVYISRNIRENIDIIKELCASVINSENGVAENLFKALANFNLAQVMAALGEHYQAKGYIDNAIESSDPSIRPQLLVWKASRLPTEADESNVNEALVLAADFVSRERLGFSEARLSELHFSESNLARLLIALRQAQEEDEFDKLLKYASTGIYAYARNPFDLLLHLAKLEIGKSKEAALLVGIAIDRYYNETVSDEHYFEAIKFAIEHQNRSDQSTHAKFVEIFEKRFEAGVDVSEQDLVASLHVLLADAGSRKASTQTRLIESVKKATKTSPLGFAYFTRLIFLKREMDILDFAQKYNECRSIADEIMRESAPGIDKHETEAASFKTIISQIRQSARERLKRFEEEATRQVRSEIFNLPDPYKGFGRNEKIQVKSNITGMVSVQKFKKVEDELRNGKVVFLKRLPGD